MEITRRTAIQVATAAGAAAVLAPAGDAETPAEKPLRFVHLTDMHIPEDGRGTRGFTAALEAIAAIRPAPDFLITGGDHVMETFKVEHDKAAAQWKLYNQLLATGTSLRIYPVIGNHDVWAWGFDGDPHKGHASYGKAMAMDQLQMKMPYYAFGADQWRIIVLDSTHRREQGGYVARIDAVQLEWLKAELAAVPKGSHICIVSHIPVLAACVFFDGKRLQPDQWQVPDQWMHRDAAELIALFRQHNVRLLVSGHIHLYDQVIYNGMTFICDGSVCANWWKGPYHETAEGFGVFDLYPDGRFTHEYRTFAWKA
jgi:3',5'-cyclic AMP phosphodiesterase CpdA